MLTPAECEFLCKNRQLYDDFATEATKILVTGRKRYSARTIAEVLRHNSAARGADTRYKINNNTIPVMARIFMKLAHCDGFFEVRDNA